MNLNIIKHSEKVKHEWNRRHSVQEGLFCARINICIWRFPISIIQVDWLQDFGIN